MKSKSIAIIVACFFIFSSCGGSSSSGSDTHTVNANLTLNFPDGSSATTSRASGLPAEVSEITLFAVSEGTYQVEENTVSLETLNTSLLLSPADFDFYVILDGTIGYIATSPASLASGTDSVDLTFDLNEGAAPMITSTTISTEDSEQTTSARIAKTIHKSYSVLPGQLVVISVGIENVDPDTQVRGVAQHGLVHFSGLNADLSTEEYTGAFVQWRAPEDEGVYPVFLILKTPKGGIAVVRTEVTVIAEPRGFNLVSVSPDPAEIGQTVTFTCDAYHNLYPDRAMISWEGAVNVSQTGTSSPLVATTAFADPGVYSANCCIRGDTGETAKCQSIDVEVVGVATAIKTCACEDATISITNPNICNFTSFTCASWYLATGGQSGDTFADEATATIDGCNLKISCP